MKLKSEFSYSCYDYKHIKIWWQKWTQPLFSNMLVFFFYSYHAIGDFYSSLLHDGTHDERPKLIIALTVSKEILRKYWTTLFRKWISFLHIFFKTRKHIL